MLVVCDTTPLNYLVQIELIDLIPRLFEGACIPRDVLRELLHPGAPAVVRKWAWSLPRWIVVRDAGAVADERLLGLDAGEAEAITLATKLNAEFLLTDDLKARAAARERGLAVLTTLLVLEAAADRGWISLAESVERLLQTNFRVDRTTIEGLLNRQKR